MPESRKRQGHHEYKKPADIPAKQRAKGRILWAILLGVFGAIISYFAGGGNMIVLIIGAVAGGLIGFFIGKKMEEESAGQ